jgi:hypothetical protein
MLCVGPHRTVTPATCSCPCWLCCSWFDIV